MEKKEIWAIGNMKKIKERCENCKGLFFGIIMVEGIGCLPCNIKKCKYTKEEMKRYGKLDDGIIVNLRILD